jgi:hypothetical protein
MMHTPSARTYFNNLKMSVETEKFLCKAPFIPLQKNIDQLRKYSEYNYVKIIFSSHLVRQNSKNLLHYLSKT